MKKKGTGTVGIFYSINFCFSPVWVLLRGWSLLYSPLQISGTTNKCLLLVTWCIISRVHRVVECGVEWWLDSRPARGRCLEVPHSINFYLEPSVKKNYFDSRHFTMGFHMLTTLLLKNSCLISVLPFLRCFFNLWFE